MYYQITTPEQVNFRYEVGGLFSRMMALMIDWAILLVLIFILSFIASLFSAVGALIGMEQMGMVVFMLGFFLLSYSYFVFFELYWRGQSPGKRIFKLRVVATSGARLNFTDSMIRNLLRPVDLLFNIVPLGGVVAMVDRYHRRLGDLAAGTLVIRDATMKLPKAILSQQARVNTFAEDATLRSRINARVTREERDLIYDLVQRRDQLDHAVREDLFAQAADLFRKRFGLSSDLEHLSDEQTVINLALLLQSGTHNSGR